MDTHSCKYTNTHARIMAASSLCCLVVLSAGCWFQPADAFKVVEGGVASLSCQYSVKRFGLNRVCWGRSCGTFWCNNILVQMDENGVISKESERYRLMGNVLDGEMDLDIVGVQWTDSGPYCCRINIAGLFNDKKVIMNLRVIRGSVLARTTSPSVTKPTPLQNVSHVTSPALSNITATSTPHVDVLLVSGVSLLFPLAALSIFLLKSGRVCDRYSGCCMCGEPRHILYEIRTRSRGQENIYTLD